MRTYAATGALLGWFALALQLCLMLIDAPRGEATLGTVITFFSFFTILTNLLVAIVFTAIAIRTNVGWWQWILPAASAGRCGGIHCHCWHHLSSISYCCGGYGTRKALSGLLTYCCMPCFQSVMSCTGCCLHRGPACAGRMP